MKIGILGGTFDPIHQGHLIMAEEVRTRLFLDKIVFVPAKIPPHKLERQITSADHRYEMVKSALKSNHEIEISDIELRRSGPSYTIDTLEYFQKQGQLYLIMGHDSFASIETWYDYERLFAMSKIVIASRPGTEKFKFANSSEFVQSFYPDKVVTVSESQVISQNDLKREWNICLFAIPGMEVSASLIRQRVSKALTIRYLVPESVRTYIYDHALYLESSDQNGGVNENSGNE